MSQIGSSSGVRVAAQPLSNVYTVLLLIGGLALALTLIVLCITMDARYGAILGVSEEGKQAKAAADAAKSRQTGEQARLQEVQEQLKRFPEGGTGAAPAVGGAPAEATPAEAAPEKAAPAEAAPEKAAPAEAAPEKAAPEKAAPAEAAPEKATPEKATPEKAAPAEAAPEKAAPEKAAPEKAAPAEAAPAEAAPADK